MSSDLAIDARQLGKVFRLYDKPIDRLKQMFVRGKRRYYREFAALSDVSFTLSRGEVLGLVGRNGAGKSTLLQLICGTLSPTSGEVKVNGRVAALLELGAGFNPEFSGRENVYLNASILGLSKAEIDQRYEAMVEFSGIRDFIHQPVKTYSSGMYVRLAFSIATSVDPDILVIDEALSVGDGAFARKSFERIMQLRDGGTTILFCSHSMYQIEALCTRAVWLEKGVVQKIGNPAMVVARYQNFLDQDAAQAQAAGAEPRSMVVPVGYGRLLAVETRVDDELGTSLEVRSARQTLGVTIKYASDPALPTPVVAVTINGPDGRILASSSTQVDQLPLLRDANGRGTATIVFPAIPLLKGEYFLWAYLLSEDGIHHYDTASNVASLHFSQNHLEQGLVSLAHRWSTEAGASLAPVAHVESANPRRLEPADELAVAVSALTIGAILDAPHDQVASQYEALAQRLGLLRRSDGAWVKQRQPRWQPRWVRGEHQRAWLELFKLAFGHDMSVDRLQWKYQGAERLGVGIWSDDDLVAFYGGMPRAISYFGRSEMAVQIGDVMVHPSQRGILTRQGPFQMAAASFLEQQIGHGKPHLVGFGFPGNTAMRLAERLKLYASVDTISELRWPPKPGRPSLSVYARAVTDADVADVDALWLDMRLALADSIVGVRDWSFLQNRYRAHPQNQYLVLLVRRRFSGVPVGVVVLNDRVDEGVELVDFVAPPDRFPELLAAGRRHAGRLGRSSIFAWITTSHAPLLADASAQTTPLDVVIPANTWSPGPTVDELQGHWWLMGGDTDFR